MIDSFRLRVNLTACLADGCLHTPRKGEAGGFPAALPPPLRSAP